jgi:hypothetical protein
VTAIDQLAEAYAIVRLNGKEGAVQSEAAPVKAGTIDNAWTKMCTLAPKRFAKFRSTRVGWCLLEFARMNEVVAPVCRVLREDQKQAKTRVDILFDLRFATHQMKQRPGSGEQLQGP